MIDRCKEAKFDGLALTVDTIVGGNRERDLLTGFTSPPKLTLKSLMSFAMHPNWAFNHYTHSRFELHQIKHWIREGNKISLNIHDYFTKMLDQSMDWKLQKK